MAAIGTIEWGIETHGKLRVRDYGVLLGHLAVEGVRLGARRLLGAVAGHRAAPLSAAAFQPPPGPAAQRARRLSEEISEPWLFNHCERTFIFAVALAAHGHAPVDYDPEVLYVASMLHDAGLTERFAGGPDDAPCFAVRGAVVARDVGHESGWSENRQRRVAEAVSMHLNLAVSAQAYPEAHLVAAAAAFDMAGLRRMRVHESVVDHAIALHPRLSLKREFPAADGVWKREAAARHGCRIGVVNVGSIVDRLVERNRAFSE